MFAGQGRPQGSGPQGQGRGQRARSSSWSTCSASTAPPTTRSPSTPGCRSSTRRSSSNFVRPDEANKAQSMVKDKGKHTFIDKVKVRYLVRRRQALGRAGQLRPQVRPHPRALPAGLRPPADGRHLGAGRHAAPVRRGGQGQAEPVLDRRASSRSSSPRSTSTSTGECRRQFTTDEWIDLLIRSIGYEPSHFDRRLKLLFLVRLIPLCERELQPRRARAAGHGQELRLPGALALRHPADRADDRRQPVLPHGERQDGAGRDLGRRRLRRGGRPPEDAQGGHHDAEDLLRVGHVRSGARKPLSGDGVASPCSATPTSPST